VTTEGVTENTSDEAVNGAGVVTASDAGRQPAAPAVDDNPAMRWFVVQAFSGFEGVVQRSLQERIERAGVQSKFGEILVPTEEVVEIRNGQKRRSERKFFPGYVLVRMEMDDETWHLVKDVPKVLGFIGEASSEGAVRCRRSGPCHRRPLQRLQRRRRGSQFRQEPLAGCGSDFRPVHTGRAGFQSGREGLIFHHLGEPGGR